MSVHNLMLETYREGDVYVGRRNARWSRHIDQQAGYFGNPHRIARGPYETEDPRRAEAVARFEADARERIACDPEFRDRVRSLEGKRLFCWCAPRRCHANVLERIADELAGAERMEGESR